MNIVLNALSAIGDGQGKIHIAVLQVRITRAPTVSEVLRASRPAADRRCSGS